MNENEKLAKYLTLARELKYLRNLIITMIPIVVSALGMLRMKVDNILEELAIKGKFETI